MRRVKIAYVVAHFPRFTETFILRELERLDAMPDLELELFSLFPGEYPVVHPTAERWLPRLHRGDDPVACLAGLVWWLRRRPLRLLASVALVMRGYARRPTVLGRALLTFGPAMAHARTMHELGVEHVHAHFASHPALAAWLASRLTGTAYSFTGHAHDLFVYQLFLSRKIRDAAFVVTVSEFNRRFLERVAGTGGTPIHLVRAGPEVTRYAYRERTLPERGPVRALCVGRMQEKKGHRHLLEALAVPSGPVARIELELVGDGELRPELEALAMRLGVGERVRFVGVLPESEVAARLERADLCVLPSIVASNGQMEGVPVSLMEACAAGAPVVATRLSGIPELVEDGVTGILAEPGSSTSLRAALERALSDPLAARERARAARRRVEAEFDLATSARRLRELFRAGHT